MPLLLEVLGPDLQNKPLLMDAEHDLSDLFMQDTIYGSLASPDGPPQLFSSDHIDHGIPLQVSWCSL